jgi:hypothetical protein
MFRLTVRDCELRLNVDEPEVSDRLAVTGDRADEVKEWIGSLYGMRGLGLDVDNICAIDLSIGIGLTGELYQILEGGDILSKPLEQLPEGAVW